MTGEGGEGLAKELRCPFCLWPLKADEALRKCDDCHAQYHDECWVENGGCAIFGCPTWAAGQGVAPRPIPPPAAPTPTPAAATATATRLPAVAAPVASFCDQCGGRVSATDSFCGSCGNTLS